jgi:hypothetical protein
MIKHVLTRALIVCALSVAALLPAKAQNFWPTPGGATAPGAVFMCLDVNGNSVPASTGGACIVSGSAVLTSIATNNWPTPGGAVAQGLVLMCLNAQGQAVPATESGTCLPSGGGGAGVSSIADNGSGTLAFSASTGAVTAGCTTATASQIGCAKFGTGLTITAGNVVPTFGTAANQVVQGGVITAGGPTGSATVAPIITYNAAGQLTTVSSATITPAIGSVTGLGTGVATLLGGNSSGTGGPVGTTSPTLITPVLGVATATSLDGAAIGAITPSTGSFTTLSITPPANTANPVAITGGSITGSGTGRLGLEITGTLNTSASVDGAGLFMNITNTASGSSTYIIDAQVGGISRFFVDTGGVTTANSLISQNNIQLASASVLLWPGRGRLGSTTAGAIEILNNANGNIVIASNPATANFQFGDFNGTSPVAQTVSFQSGSGTNIAGVSSTIIGSLSTGTGTDGDLIFQTGVKNGSSGSGAATATTALTIKGETQALVTSASDAASSTGGALQVVGGASVAKRFWIPAISASSGLQTAVLCQSSGGEMIADSVACLASSARFKNIIGPFSNGAAAKLSKLPIERWSYKSEGVFQQGDWTRERLGPIAEDVAAMDPRLAGYDADGNVRSYSTEQLLAFTIKSWQEDHARLQQQQVEIDQIKEKLH